MVRVVVIILGFLMYNASNAQYMRNNTKTEQHIQIPGTKFFIVPPDGFIIADGFLGFQQNETGASIVVIEVPRAYKDVKAAFDVDALRKKGILLKNEEYFSINKNQAYIATLQQKTNNIEFTKQVLLLGKKGETYMLNGMYPKEYKQLKKPVRDAFLTIVYDSKALINPYEGIDFRIDTKGTKLVLAKSIAGTLMYTTDGNLPPKGKDNTVFMIGSSLLTDMEDKKALFVKKLKELPYKNFNFKEENIKEITINGISGYVLSTNALHKSINKKTNKKDFIYQVILFKEYTYYQMVGTTTEGAFKSQLLFEKLANTFRVL